jgi:hypothetical protein
VSDPGIVAIRIRHGDAVFHVHGEHAGFEGVTLGQGQVDGIYEAPTKTTYKAGAFQIGSTYKSHKFLHRDMNLGFNITETVSNLFEWNESLFQQIFTYALDRWSLDPVKTVIEVETELSGVRHIDVLKYQEPDFSSASDPLMNQYGNPIMKLRAADPMWYEDDVTTQYTSGATSASGFILIENPTDQIMYHKWILTPATWTLPDRQWIGDPGRRTTGGAQGGRVLDNIVITAANGGAVGDLDRQELMWRDLNNTNLLGQLGGAKILVYPIPPYTPPTQLPISYSAAPAGGAMAQLVQPRRWSRPWGLEGISITGTGVDNDVTIRFSTVGSYEFTIPAWADAIDVVLVGGGAGGGGGLGFVGGVGGLAGNFATKTLVRGVDIPTGTTIIAGVIGDGGAGGAIGGFTNGHAGTATTAVGSGMTTVNAAGGSGVNTLNGFGIYNGQEAADLTFNGKVYPGGDAQNAAYLPGNSPGGGGPGGFLDGLPGARGQAWFRAYKVLNKVVQPGKASLILSGSAPKINIVMVVPSGATLTLTGGTPDVRVNSQTRVTPTAATLTLTGKAPTVS